MKKVIVLILIAVMLAGCSAPPAPAEEPAPAGKEISGLTWESSIELEYATQFTVDYYEGGYALIAVADGCKYLVVPEDMPVPENCLLYTSDAADD